MKTILISDITLTPDRQRRTFDPAKMQEFAEGIDKRGLLHPIILRRDGPLHILVAGERRLRAVDSLAALGNAIKHDGDSVPLGAIPYTLLSDLSPLAAEEAELEENIHREDLTWQERSAALLRLQALRVAQAAAAGAPPPTVADLSIEVRGSGDGNYQDRTRQELIVAKHLHKPEVAAAKTVAEAFKFLQREEAADKSRSLGESVGRTYSANLHRLLNTDSLAWMKSAATEQFDVILTDPPYGMGADEFGDSSGKAAGAHAYVDSEENALACYATLATEGFRLAKPQAHIYAFCDFDMFPRIRALFEAAGWWTFRTPLLWHKPLAPRAPWPEHGPQRKYECIIYAVKGKRKALKIAPDVLTFNSDTNLGHAAQKPVALYEELLRRSCYPGDTVFDPFCGTGPLIAAAQALRCVATAIELDTAAYGVAVSRLRTFDAHLELPL